MIFYKALDKVDSETLYKTFVKAFSDYQVKIDLPLWKFQQMLQRRGYGSELSIGAFKDDMLIGFSLNGFRTWNSKATAYDIATGIIPECRRQGITSSIFLRMKELLKEEQVEQYLLEVIKSNQPAVQLYQKQGFKIQREFSCFQLNKNKFIPREIYKVERVERIDFEQIKDFWDYKPSWQNSAASINAVSETFTYSVVSIDNIIAGYGIIDEKTGDIPQIAVNKGYRGNGIASSIMTEIVKSSESEKISVLNVEANLRPVENFLIKSGFERYVDQYEMLLTL
jgi:ribosomal protein S18 acetylase RimI-like enzyme